MPLSPFQTFVYFMYVVLFWTWPVILIVLIVAFFCKCFLRTLIWVLVALPVVGLLLQLAIHWEYKREENKIEKHRQLLDRHFGARDRTTRFKGSFEGTLLRNSLTYRRFYFRGVLTGERERTLEILMPPDNVITLAYLSEFSGKTTELEPALLVVVADDNYNPEFPEIPPDVPLNNILLLRLDGRYDRLWCTDQSDPTSLEMRWNEVYIDYDSLGGTPVPGK